jgi:hypothetical protein
VGIFSGWLRGKTVKQFVVEAERTVNIYRSFGPRELAENRVAVALSLNFLAFQDHTSGRNMMLTAFDAMNNPRFLTKQESGELSFYNVHIMNLQKAAFSRPEAEMKLIASGMPLWITSIRAISFVEILPYAREIWSCLDKVKDSEVYFETANYFGARVSNHLGGLVTKLDRLETPGLFVAT